MIGGAPARLSVVILAGGRSRRMGRDKRALPWPSAAQTDGATLLHHVAASVRAVTDDLLLVANDHPQVDGARIVGDLFPNAGSLGGVYSGLAAAAHDLAFVAAADMPFLDRALILDLVGRVGAADAVVPMIDGYPEPLHAVYRKTALRAMRARIVRRRLKIAPVFDDLAAVRVDERQLRAVSPDLRSFQNLNTPADYQRARSGMPLTERKRR